MGQLTLWVSSSCLEWGYSWGYRLRYQLEKQGN